MTYKMFTTRTLLSLVFFTFMIDSAYGLTSEEIRKELGPPRMLESSKKISWYPGSAAKSYPAIYCYKAESKSLDNLWMTCEVVISINPDQYRLYRGSSEEEVLQQYLEDQSLLNLNVLIWKHKDIKLNPFNNTCLGIVTSDVYSLELKVHKFDTLKQWMFMGGMTLFYLAKTLAPDPFFYYITGVTGGVLLSVLILVYFILSLLPLKKTTIATVMAGGSGLLFLAMDWIFNMLTMAMMKYQIYIIGYVVASAIISFFICYRYGPVTNQQSINIIQWCLQGAGAVAIWFSSYYQEAVFVIIGLMVFLYYVPFFKYSYRLIRFLIFFLATAIQKIVLIQAVWMDNSSLMLENFLKRMFLRLKYKIWGYPPPQLLTQQQYRQQAKRETRRAMSELYNAYHNGTINPFEALYRMTPDGRAKMLRFLTDRDGHVSYDERDEHHFNYDGIMTEDEDDDNEED